MRYIGRLLEVVREDVFFAWQFPIKWREKVTYFSSRPILCSCTVILRGWKGKALALQSAIDWKNGKRKSWSFSSSYKQTVCLHLSREKETGKSFSCGIRNRGKIYRICNPAKSAHGERKKPDIRSPVFFQRQNPEFNWNCKTAKKEGKINVGRRFSLGEGEGRDPGESQRTEEKQRRDGRGYLTWLSNTLFAAFVN